MWWIPVAVSAALLAVLAAFSFVPALRAFAKDSETNIISWAEMALGTVGALVAGIDWEPLIQFISTGGLAGEAGLKSGFWIGAAIVIRGGFGLWARQHRATDL